MMSSNPAGESAFIVMLVNGLMFVCCASGVNVGVLGGSRVLVLLLGDNASAPCKGGDFMRIGSGCAGINVSNAALG
jgi:hypothetical protein